MDQILKIVKIVLLHNQFLLQIKKTENISLIYQEKIHQFL